MVDDQPQQQGSEPGYVVMTPEDVIALSRKAADEAVSRYRSQAEDGDGSNLIGLDGKFVKQLQNTVGVFNALKDFSSSPLQKVVEEKVGQFAAGMVENAFSGPRSSEKKSLIETILNSQFAYGLGASIGNKSPELIEAMSRNLGREQTQHIIDNVITKGTQGQGQVSGGKGSQQDNVELLLSLDANNPEHIAAYSDSQGGLPPDVARKMLMIHQDAIIKKFGDQGANVQKAGTGQRVQSPSTSTRPQPHTPVVEQIHKDTSEEPMQYTNYNEFPGEGVAQKGDTTQPNVQGQSPGGSSNNEMLDVMKKFSNDVGLAMNTMIDEISTLKGTVTQLRGEIDTIRSNRPMPLGTQSPTVRQPPVAPPVVQSITNQPRVASHQPRIVSYQPIVDPIAERRKDTGLGKQEDGLIEQDIYSKSIEQEAVVEPIEQNIRTGLTEQEQEKSFEEIMGIRERRMTAEELTDIKPKEVVRQPIQSERPINTGQDIMWTDEDLAKDIANVEKAKESNKSVPKPKNITEEIIKVVEENRVVSDTEKIQRAKGITGSDMITNVEEKRPIVPIKRSDIYKKIKPSIKKTENGVT